MEAMHAECKLCGAQGVRYDRVTHHPLCLASLGALLSTNIYKTINTHPQQPPASPHKPQA
jgi:hypothetical protein